MKTWSGDTKPTLTRRIVSPAPPVFPVSHRTHGCRALDGLFDISSSTEGMAAGNIIAGGVIGLGIDAATGAMNHYNADNQIAMVPVAGCKPAT